MIGIGITDLDWFRSLREDASFRVINFWTPTDWQIRSLQPGDLFYFFYNMLKSPVRKIGGCGRFLEYRMMTTEEAWNSFGRANGVSNLHDLVSKITGYAGRRSSLFATSPNPTIGCILLEDPVLLEDDQFVDPDEVGAPFGKFVVKWKGYDDIDELALPDITPTNAEPFELVGDAERIRRETRYTPRPGRATFRKAVLDAYGHRCAISGEGCLEVLQAAHIEAYVDERSDDVRNGVALRSDLHSLFDAGLITISVDCRVRISPRLSSPTYRQFEGQMLSLPQDPARRPATVALSFHNSRVFRSHSRHERRQNCRRIRCCKTGTFTGC